MRVDLQQPRTFSQKIYLIGGGGKKFTVSGPCTRMGWRILAAWHRLVLLQPSLQIVLSRDHPALLSSLCLFISGIKSETSYYGVYKSR